MPFVREIDNSTVEEELTRAVRRVYERYGTDLSEFFRDVQRRTEKDQLSLFPTPEIARNEQTDR
jgi:hypothetical protein